jgi:hypothetical protein
LVANEAGVETGQLTSMLGLMQRNIDALAEGTKAQVEAFKRLGLSISDLQGLSPDEQFARIAEALDKISDPTQKTALAMDVFGRSGRNAINMLDSYRAKTQEAATFQERFGIAVRQSTAESIERANDAVGRLGMVMEGLGNRLAGLVAPAIERTANGLINFAATVLGIRVELEQFFGTLEMARASLGEDLFLKIMGRPDLIRDHAPSIAAVVNEMDQLQTIAVALAPQLRIFADELEDIDAEATRLARIELEGLANSIKQAEEDFKNGIITQEQYNLEPTRLSIILTLATHLRISPLWRSDILMRQRLRLLPAPISKRRYLRKRLPVKPWAAMQGAARLRIGPSLFQKGLPLKSVAALQDRAAVAVLCVMPWPKGWKP